MSLSHSGTARLVAANYSARPAAFSYPVTSHAGFPPARGAVFRDEAVLVLQSVLMEAGGMSAWLVEYHLLTADVYADLG